MKYSKANPPLVCMMTQSTCYKGTRTMNVLGVLWHSTGANNPNLRRYVQPDDKAPDRAALLAKLGTNGNRNDWNHATVQAGLNAWVGKLADGTVSAVQTMPWNYRPWGCGSGAKGSCNSGWIQFEICEDSLTDPAYFAAAYKEATELTAYLCQLYGIDPKGTATLNGVKVPTILCHADSHTLGLGSNHGDVLHWFPRFGKSMDTVRADVAALLAGSVTPEPAPAPSPEGGTIYRVRKVWTDPASQIGAFKQLDNAQRYADAHPGYAVYDETGKQVYPAQPYLVKVTATGLRIRTGPGTGYNATGTIDPGTYTIVEESAGAGSTAGWGKLKSGAGWIALDYAQKI